MAKLPSPELYEDWRQFAAELVAVLEEELTPSINKVLQLDRYPVSNLPKATEPGLLIYVTDDATQAQPAYSDGTNWRRVIDGTIVA